VLSDERAQSALRFLDLSPTLLSAKAKERSLPQGPERSPVSFPVADPGAAESENGTDLASLGEN